MIDRRSVAVLRVVLPLAALTVLAQVAHPLVRGGTRDALTVATVLLFAAASLAHALATRGVRTAATVLVVLGCGGLLAEAVGTRTGFPFGPYTYADTLGPAVLGVPAVIPPAWVMMGWPAWLVGSRLAGPRAGRARRALVAGVALATWDLFLDPQMVAAGHWRWADPAPALPGVPDVPLTNYAGWLAVAIAMAALLDVALPAAARAPAPADTVPYALYLWTYASSVLAHAAFFGLPASALWGALGMGLVAVPLARSLRPRARAAAR